MMNVSPDEQQEIVNFLTIVLLEAWRGNEIAIAWMDSAQAAAMAKKIGRTGWPPAIDFENQQDFTIKSRR